MQIPFIYLYSKWNAYPDTINSIFDDEKMSCKQLARVLSLSMQQVHQWLVSRQIKSIERCFGSNGGIAFYKKEEIISHLSADEQDQLNFITMSELSFITGINLDRLRKFLLKNKNIEAIMTKPRTGKLIPAYNKEAVLNILKERR